MKKKFLLLFVSMVLVFNLVACGGDEEPVKETDQIQQEQQVDPTQNEEMNDNLPEDANDAGDKAEDTLEDADKKTEDTLDDAGNKVEESITDDNSTNE